MLQYLDEYFRAPFITTTLIAIGVCFIVSQLWNHSRRKGKLPPGPIGLPVVGYLPFILSKDLHKTLYGLSKKYGDVFSLKLGQINTVVLNSYEALKDSGRKDEFANRPPGFFYFSDTNNHIGIMNGKQFKEQRKFMISTLRNMGMGKLQVEESIREQIKLVLEELKLKPNDEDVNIRDILTTTANNVVLSLVCGKTYERNHKIDKLLANYQLKLMQYFETLRIPFYFPLLRRIYPKISGSLRKIKEELMAFEDHISQEIQGRLKNPRIENMKEDYIDFFLREVKSNKDNPETTFTMKALLGMGQVILMAGSETTRGAIEWILLCAARHQLFQEMLYQQIIEVLGTDGEPQFKDRERLVLVHALILESSRWKTPLGISDPHWTSDDVELSGYLIPKNTLVLLNLYAVHNDKEHWGDPENFRPERFLSKDFKSITNTERVVAFGLGKRNCPGEKLAEIEVFIVVTSLLQKFRFLPPEKGVCMEEITNITQMVVSPLIRVEPR